MRHGIAPVLLFSKKFYHRQKIESIKEAAYTASLSFTFLRFLYPALSALPSVLYEAGLSAHPIIDSFE